MSKEEEATAYSHCSYNLTLSIDPGLGAATVARPSCIVLQFIACEFT